MEFPDIFGRKEQKEDEKPEVKSGEVIVTVSLKHAAVLTCGYFTCMYNQREDKSCNLKHVALDQSGNCASFQPKKQEP